MAAFVPPGGHIAVARSRWSRGAFVALILDEGGGPVAVAKSASSAADRRKLRGESIAAGELGERLAPPVSVPRVIARCEGVVLWEAIQWKMRFPSWRPPAVVLHRLGELFRSGPDAPDAGPAHGDFAPWNLLETADGWVLVDWADARYEAPPFYDVLHYLVQSHIFLGRPSTRALFDGVVAGRGWVGKSLRAYASGAGLPWYAAQEHLVDYLQRSRIDTSERAVRNRDRLLLSWGEHRAR